MQKSSPSSQKLKSYINAEGKKIFLLKVKKKAKYSEQAPPGQKVPHSSAVESNTTTAEQPKKQGKLYLHWFFTWNNYPEDWEKKFISSKILKKYVIGKEVGKQGTKHLQGNISLYPDKNRKGKRLTALKKLFDKGIHWEPSYSNEDCVTRYCIKDKDFIIKGYKLPFMMKLEQLHLWQVHLLRILKGDPSNRKIHWIWSQGGGLGKTTFQKFYCSRNPKMAMVTGGKVTDMKNSVVEFEKKNNYLPRVVFVNVCKAQTLRRRDYIGMEAIKDMFFYSGKYEGGEIIGDPPHLFVFANQPPDYEMMTNRFIEVAL